jgi:hypothetical protein
VTDLIGNSNSYAALQGAEIRKIQSETSGIPQADRTA